MLSMPAKKAGIRKYRQSRFVMVSSAAGCVSSIAGASSSDHYAMLTGLVATVQGARLHAFRSRRERSAVVTGKTASVQVLQSTDQAVVRGAAGDRALSVRRGFSVLSGWALRCHAQAVLMMVARSE